MLLLLLFAYFAHNATQALTIPLEREYRSDTLFPRLGDQYFDDRTVWSIVWSCLATLFACSWVAVHPNVPRATDSGALILGRRLAMMGYMLLAPEVVILWAARQFFIAKEITVEHQGKGAQPTAIYQICDSPVTIAREWTKAHGFFVIMGGFALHDADKSFLRVLDENTLKELDKEGEIEWPTITEKEIQDRSKADIFSKGIVLVQTTWFIVQCVSRFATKLAVTELEVVTLAFAVLNGITYWLWWDKPSDVRCAVPVYLKSAGKSSNSKVFKARRQRDTSISPSTKGFFSSLVVSFRDRRNKHGLILAILYTLFWVPIRVTIINPLEEVGSGEIPENDVTRVPTFYSPIEKKVLGVRPTFWALLGVTALFGAIHFIPWSFIFPTTAERWLWRISAILITCGPLLFVFLSLIIFWFTDSILENSISKALFILVYSILIAAYIISRIILLVLPLMLLRNLPPTALHELKWSEFFPHI